MRRTEQFLIQGDGVHVRPVRESDAREFAVLLSENRRHLEPYEPRRAPSYYTEAYQRAVLREAVDSYSRGTGYMFAVETDYGKIIGRVALSGVFRGAFQSCFIGYFIDHRFTGRGLATWAVGHVVRFAMSQAGLHRVEASVMPRNIASQRVLEKCGFRREGLSLRYLEIQGKWEDHFIYAITKEEVL
jgi:ribosomal-protein-alanine N-acetyltransferase